MITSSNNLITSNEKNKIEVNDPFLHITNADYSFHICIDRPAKQSVIGDNGIDYFLGNCKKVIAQQDQINFSALSEEEQKEIGYFDVEKFALDSSGFLEGENYASYKLGVLNGFQKAQELLSDRRFTLEEIEWSFMRGTLINQRSHKGEKLSFSKERDKDIQSLSKPKSWKIDGLWENNKFKITKIWN